MRFMMSLPAPVEAQVSFTPTLELVTAMRKYSDDMRKAGVLLLAEGFDPRSKASAGSPTDLFAECSAGITQQNLVKRPFLHIRGLTSLAKPG